MRSLWTDHMVKTASPETKKLAPRKRGGPQLTDRQAEIVRAVKIYGTHTEAARHLGISRQRVSRVVAYANRADVCSSC
jgi:DNA-directed RNA polymerase specialized sigma subunit